jgi:hypothetical protein
VVRRETARLLKVNPIQPDKGQEEITRIRRGVEPPTKEELEQAVKSA